jgi:hypothetical protein
LALMAVFTANFVAGLKPGPKIHEESDAGCPGLVIRVGQRGRKVWEVVVSRDGRRRRNRFGTFPDISLAMARRPASEHKSAPEIHLQGFRVSDLRAMYQAERKPKRRAFADVEKVWREWAQPRIGNLRLEVLTMRHGSELIAFGVEQAPPRGAAERRAGGLTGRLAPVPPACVLNPTWTPCGAGILAARSDRGRNGRHRLALP